VNQIQERDYDDEAVYFNIPPVQRTYLSMALEQAISRRELVDKEIQGRLQEEARQRNIDVGSAIRKLGYITARIREARSYDEFRYFQEEQEYFLRSLPPQIRMRVMTSAEKEDRDEGCPICGKINCPNWPF
jgi:ASC-1-like (ASCH) protein